MISALSKYFAACAEYIIINTAPIEKFGAIKQEIFFSFDNVFNSEICSSDKPVVPITGRIPFFKHVFAFSKIDFGCVKSINTSIYTDFIASSIEAYSPL